MKIINNSSFWKVSAKTDITIFFSVFFTYYSTGQNWFSTCFRIWHFLDIIIINNYIKLMFWGLGTMLERFFEVKSFGLHISKPKYVPGNTFVDVSKMIVWCLCITVSWLCIMAMYHGCIMAMYHGYVSWLCIMGMYHGYVS